MRRLKDFQPVTLHLGGHALTATVAAVDSSRALLHADSPQLPSLHLPARGDLGFAHRGHHVLLVGIVMHEGGQRLSFLPEATGLVPSRRNAPRLALGLPTTLTLPDGTTVVTTTIDVSPTGLLVQAHGLGEPGTVIGVRLQLPGAHGEIATDARVVRTTAEGTGLHLGDLDVPGTATLAALVNEVRLSLAERFSGRRA